MFLSYKICSIVEFTNQEGMDKALDMFQDYDYDGTKLTIKPFEVKFLFNL